MIPLALAYLVLDTADLDAWERFAADILGVQIDRREGEWRGRIDDRRQRLVVRAGSIERLVAVGLEVPSSDDLDEIAERLRATGAPVRTGDPERCADRDVAALIETSDPAGTPIEIVTGHGRSDEPFASPTGARFVSGDEVGLGHVVFGVADLDAALAFYGDVLGFGTSDTMTLGPASLAFLHANERHHTVAVMGVGADVGLHHFMLEVDSVDTVGASYDRVLADGRPLEFTLGRHTNDEMVSFYVRSPSGFSVEFGTGGRRVTPGAWTPGHYDAPSRWGHATSSA